MRDSILNYEEQVEWNRLMNLHVYINNETDIDDVHKNLINVLVKGFSSMINTENKTTVMQSLCELLTQTRRNYEREQELKRQNNRTCNT
ncbi:hypothetical protein CaLGV005 [Clostera anastomosis granulovirus A]|uniref:Uncharacterized protein n=1 Tax=Clostera anastomosis granulovirus A TaxID=1986289 RepID=U5KBT4_9BBAC|nr:hypothetical protein CaLGV005 [Clostera anastomosis granulovirus Henan]AGQ20264.1 hypothetical protein CaLGV005 [Clostera anastomosis granulovirus Henan]